jgi:hypothetical protein
VPFFCLFTSTILFQPSYFNHLISTILLQECLIARFAGRLAPLVLGFSFFLKVVREKERSYPQNTGSVNPPLWYYSRSAILGLGMIPASGGEAMRDRVSFSP